MSEEQKVTTETADDNSKGTDEQEAKDGKTAETRVTSANDWEHADLGDDSRKEKFLKLMGAAKDEHKGKILIGENPAQHKPDDPEKLNKGLEEQFEYGLQRKLTSGYKSHKGLGFSQEDGDVSRDSPSTVREVGATPDTDVVEERRRVTDDSAANGKSTDSADAKASEAADKDHSEKRAADTMPAGDTVIPKKKAMMNFVKASDS